MKRYRLGLQMNRLGKKNTHANRLQTSNREKVGCGEHVCSIQSEHVKIYENAPTGLKLLILMVKFTVLLDLTLFKFKGFLNK